MARDSCRRRGKGSAVLNAAVLAACMHASQAFTVSPALRSMAPFPFKSLTGPRGGGRPALAARGGIFGLRAQYVPLDDALILQEDPDHPVLKDPARLKIRKTEEEVTIYSNGTCVTSYKTPGYDVFFLRPDAVFDGSKPISGGAPLCFPQFGPGDMQQHGFARNMQWSLTDWRQEASAGAREFSWLSDKSLAVYELQDTKYTRSMWPYRFHARYMVELSAGCLKLDWRITNKGDRSMNFSAAVHSYYHVRDIDTCEIHGNFKGVKYLDKVTGEMKTEDRDVLTIKGFTDSVYYGVEGDVELVDGDRSVTISSNEEWKDIIIWNPYGEEKMGYKNFVCIENGRISDVVVLPPQGMWASRVEISPFKDGLPAYLSYLPEQDDEEDDVEDVEEDQVEAE